MNVLILEKYQFLDESRAVATPRQSTHICSVLRLAVGDLISLGIVDGAIGTGIIEQLGNHVVIGRIQLTGEPPPQRPLTLILALPRPQMLKRILQTVATMGVKKVCFLQTGRVEKSFWQSPSATDAAMREQLILGLEQGMATQLPLIERHTRFRPFIEDHLENLVGDSSKYIAHPTAKNVGQSHAPDHEITLAIGPEGGFLEKEVHAFEKHGFYPISLGRRILKVETAVPVLLTTLFRDDV